MDRQRQRSRFSEGKGFGSASSEIETRPQSISIDPSLLIEKSPTEGLLPNPLGIIPLPSASEKVEDQLEDLEIAKYQCIGSYSWLESAINKPTILVPGSPLKWRNRSFPCQVPQDKGVHIVDQNGFRTSSGGISYLLPIIASVIYDRRLQKESPFDWSSVDIIADRAALRKLNRWAKQKLFPSTKKYDESFRLDLQLAGKKTILINRVSLKYAEKYRPYTYRTGFEKAFMTPSTGFDTLDYYRIVNYDMNGLNMIVRFEVDAYAPDLGVDDEVDELTISLEASNLEQSRALQLHGLTIRKGGTKISTSSVLELNTRGVAKRHPMDWTEVYCQLFLSKTPKHIVARHDNGVFKEIQERSLNSAPEFEAVKTRAQKQLKVLCRVLNFIRDIVMKRGKDSRLSLVCKDGVLTLYNRESQESCLPDDVLELFQ